MIVNIGCSVRELEGRNNKWRVSNEGKDAWTSFPIDNMLLSFMYFDGTYIVKYGISRKFGKIVKRIVVTNKDKSVRKVYDFDYSSAYVV